MESRLKRDASANISYAGAQSDFPVYDGTLGRKVIDVRSLMKELNMFTYDPGFTSTASCESQITFIDGIKGELLYRGYPIEDLAEHSSFLECAALLLDGELPTKEGLAQFEREVAHTQLPEQVNQIYAAYSRNCHPMAILIGALGALSATHYDGMDVDDPAWLRACAVKLIGQVPIIAARILRHSTGQNFVKPDPELTYAENFLQMCFAKEGEPYQLSPVLADAMDKIFILHADHEQNASTSTVRLACSSDANPVACMAAGAASLWGPAHGGANEAALDMMAEIGDPKRIPEFVARAKDRDDPFRLMGFGHRVYKNYDPRAKVLKETAHKVFAELGTNEDPLLEIAQALETVALNDDYFIERNLYPNVDFYSGIIFKALGFPKNYLTVLFALARTSGWIAQLCELRADPQQRIGRPRQIYTGAPRRAYPQDRF